ncbi:fimbria/pilus periplasmic chaperone [Providencia rettgeri]
MIIYKNFLYALLFFTLFLFSLISHAGGVALGSTRVIYPLNDKQTSLALSNTDERNQFLIQTWVEDKEGKKTKDIIITPPLFVSKPKSENTLRIILNNSNLPKDRESLYWINSKSIPAVDKNDIKDKNILQIAVLSRIKLFVRPENLNTLPSDAPELLIFNYKNNNLTIKNPSPYYMTLINLKYGEEKLSSIMIPPMDEYLLKVNSKKNIISYQTINDYGANTPLITKNIN